MNKAILFILISFSGKLMACPLCIGQNPQDQYYVYIVGIFILLIYFPMFYMFKTFYKLRNINNKEDPK